MHIIFNSTPKNLDERPHKIITPVKATASAELKEDTEPEDETYEVVEMQVTSSAKTRYAPAQMPQEGTANKTQPVESEASKDSTAQEEEYVNFDWVYNNFNIIASLNNVW